jgi:hypothetical protein
MNPDQAYNFPFGAYQDGFEKLIGNKQFTGVPVSNTPAQRAQVYMSSNFVFMRRHAQLSYKGVFEISYLKAQDLSYFSRMA